MNASDCARVLRVPGTQNFKYSPPGEVGVVRSEPKTYALEEIEEALADVVEPSASNNGKGPSRRKGSSSIADIESALKVIKADDRRVWLLIGMALNAELGDQGRDVWDKWSQTSPEKYDAVNQDETWRSFDPQGGVAIGTLFKFAKDAGWKTPGFTQADIKFADRFLSKHGDDLLYCSARGWFHWDGQSWALDEKDEVIRLAVDEVRALYREVAEQEPDSDDAKKLAKFALAYSKAERINGALRLARAKVTVTANELDQRPFLLNVANGTIDLRTGKIRTASREDLITNLIPIPYVPDAPAPSWRQFLNEVFDGDSELCDYVKRAIGYSLTADQREKCFWFLHGPTDTGKSTFGAIVLALASSYGQGTPVTLFLASRGEQVPTDQARLKGMRFVLATETAESRRLDPEKIKKLTGNDVITARFMRQDFFDFAPTHHLWLISNYRPKAPAKDDALWNRVKLIPFLIRFEDLEDAPHRKDLGLRDRLLGELPGILAWAVEGAREWYDKGLAEPKAVTVATAEYRSKEDTLAAFIAECLETKAGAKVKRTAVWNAYSDWSQGERNKMGRNELNTALRELYGFKESGDREWLDHQVRPGLAEEVGEEMIKKKRF